MKKIDFAINDTVIHRIAEDGTGRRTMIIADDVEALDNPDFSALLNLSTKRGGISFPVVSNQEMHAIAEPKLGLMVYNSDEESAYIYTKKRGWFNISGLRLPSGSRQNSIAVWSDKDGDVLQDSNIRIQDDVMIFDAGSSIDLQDGSLDAKDIHCDTLELRSHLSARHIETNEINSNVLNSNNINSNNINANHANFNNIDTNRLKADYIDAILGITGNTLNLRPLSRNERNKIRSPKAGDLICMKDKADTLNIFLNGTWQAVVTTIIED